jgi:hypothetical protein
MVAIDQFDCTSVGQNITSKYLLGVEPLIQQSELRTYTKVVFFFKEKVPFHLLKNIKCNGINKIGN